ncbi:MAG: diguanylate cyclase [Clostridiales bacterium]|nr:diguanylate cyclase [Clostridiales bacterium]
MELTYIFIVGSSLVLLSVVSVFAIRNLSVAGSRAFLLQIVFVTIWSIGSLLEMLSQTEQEMLLWRNIEQIGVFFLPVACVYFAVDYARYDRMKKYVPLLLIIPVIAILLIFTDSSTHIMRTGYTVSYSPIFGKALSVQQTGIGKVFVAYNYVLAFASLVILFVFSRQVSKGPRRQVMLVLVATGLVFVLAFFKAAFLEGTRINLPIVTIYLPGGLILFYNLYKNDFFSVSPVARDKAFDVIELGILVTDGSGMIADINPCAVQILSACFGIREKLTGRKMDDVFGAFPDWVDLTSRFAAGETELHLTANDPCFIHIRVYPLQSRRGPSIGSVTIMRDVTVLREQEFALKLKAETDSLTGLLNRESFMDQFAQELGNTAPTGAPVSVLMMDLDKFKGINDTYGHNNGDQVIRAFADLLRDALRHEDAVARIGGDEFAAVLPGVGGKEAVEIADRILIAANDRAVQLDSELSVQLKLSIGICDNAIAKSEEEMLKCADKAMYMAKSKAGNCCVVWE